MNNYLSQAVFFECQNKNCKFRIPYVDFPNHPDNCPFCGCEMVNKEIIGITEDHRKNDNWESPIKIFVVLDNVRSVNNVGAIFLELLLGMAYSIFSFSDHAQSRI